MPPHCGGNRQAGALSAQAAATDSDFRERHPGRPQIFNHSKKNGKRMETSANDLASTGGRFEQRPNHIQGGRPLNNPYWVLYRLRAGGKKFEGARMEGESMTQQEKIKAAERQLNESGSAENRRLVEISEALKDDRRVLRLTARMKAAAPGSIMWMEAKHALNRIYLEGMTEDERESTKEGRQLMAETGELYRAIRAARKAMREAEPDEEAAEDQPNEENPWKLTWPKALQAIFTGVATWIILRMICG